MKHYSLHELVKTDPPLLVRVEQSTQRRQVIHTHDCIEIMLIRQGAGWCAVNNHHYPVISGDLFLMGPGDCHEFFLMHDPSFYTIMFDRTLFSKEEFSRLVPFKCFREIDCDSFSIPGKLFIGQDCQSEIYAVLNRIIKESKSLSIGYGAMVKALFMQFLILVGRNETIQENFKDYRSQVSIVMNYISQNFASKLTLDGIAGKTGLSPEYLGRMFKKKTGNNITEYITAFRMEKARKMLEERTCSISEVAYRTGFFDVAHFSKTFKKLVGLTPRAFLNGLKPDSCVPAASSDYSATQPD